MPSSYMRGALVQFTKTLLIPTPNIIIFQYNPETISHSWTQVQRAAPAAAKTTPGTPPPGNPLAVSGMPGEAFSFTLVMDANDQIGEGNPLTIASGIYSRLAALEMLLFPDSTPGLGSLVGSIGAALGAIGSSSGVTITVPQGNLPTALFIWGPGRIVPVRVTGLSINEKTYDALLNPIHAEAQIQMSVLTPDELSSLSTSDSMLAHISTAAYAYTQALREALSIANLANSVESIIGMIPM